MNTHPILAAYPHAFSVTALSMAAASYGGLPGPIERISENSSGQPGNGYSYSALYPNASHFSADGRYVAFFSEASNLVPDDTNGEADVFVYDRDSGIIEIISRASSDANGLGTQGNYSSYFPSISGDGRYVAFTSDATNLADNDTNGRADVFVYDRDTDTIELVSRASSDANGLGTQGNHHSATPALSPDGRFVAFASRATNLVANDTNGQSADIFVYDRDTDTIELVSRASSDANGLGTQGNHNSATPAISGDGRYVAFESTSTNLAANDTNGIDNIFVYDRDTDTIELISRASSEGNELGAQGLLPSYRPFISADGRYVAFESSSPNLVANDTNGGSDIFVRDRDNDTTERVSTTETGVQTNGSSLFPALSPDGSAVMFSSYAQNLAGPSNYFQVYVKQLRTNTAPVAQAGNDQVVEASANPNTDVMFSGSDCSDDDGDTLTYTWSGDFGETSGENVTIALPLGTHVITLTVSDGELSSTDDLTVIVEDTTHPVLTPPTDVQGFASGALTSVEIGEAQATDLFEVMVSSNAPAQFPPGVTEVTWTATDASGNQATATQMITVWYELIGFYSPIENLPVLNVAKAGQVIPVKWSVPSSAGGFIQDTAIVQSIQFSTESCSGETVGSTDITDAQSTGKAGLRYDEASEQFIFNWKTGKSMKGSCRLLHLKLRDGQAYQAKFKLR